MKPTCGLIFAAIAGLGLGHPIMEKSLTRRQPIQFGENAEVDYGRVQDEFDRENPDPSSSRKTLNGIPTGSINYGGVNLGGPKIDDGQSNVSRNGALDEKNPKRKPDRADIRPINKGGEKGILGGVPVDRVDVSGRNGVQTDRTRTKVDHFLPHDPNGFPDEAF